MYVKPRYVVTVYHYNSTERCYSPSVEYAMGHSLANARRRADAEMASMPVITSTWELRPYARSSFALVTRDGRRVYGADQQVEFVPSIGERGY